MRHSKHKNTLNLKEAHRKAMLNNMAINLIKSNRITTTFKKAKITSQFTDQLITIAKQNDLTARRRLFSILKSRELVKYVVEELAPRFANRKGGYTRVIRYKNRPGDGALTAILEFTEIPEVTPKKDTKKKAKKDKAPAEKVKKETRAKESADSDVKKQPDKGFFKKLKRNIKSK
jgi:large subunit ribosomal protein L17